VLKSHVGIEKKMWSTEWMRTKGPGVKRSVDSKRLPNCLQEMRGRAREDGRGEVNKMDFQDRLRRGGALELDPDSLAHLRARKNTKKRDVPYLRRGS